MFKKAIVLSICGLLSFAGAQAASSSSISSHHHHHHHKSHSVKKIEKEVTKARKDVVHAQHKVEKKSTELKKAEMKAQYKVQKLSALTDILKNKTGQ